MGAVGALGRSGSAPRLVGAFGAAPVEVPPLEDHARELPCIVDDYVRDAIAFLGASQGRFTGADREDVVIAAVRSPRPRGDTTRTTLQAPDERTTPSTASRFAYDVFVVHADAATDEAFVNGYLLANLGLPPERVFRLQTLELGQFITQEIERGVRSSRVTIAVGGVHG